jgi:hypothetical protein
MNTIDAMIKIEEIQREVNAVQNWLAEYVERDFDKHVALQLGSARSSLRNAYSSLVRAHEAFGRSSVDDEDGPE